MRFSLPDTTAGDIAERQGGPERRRLAVDQRKAPLWVMETRQRRQRRLYTLANDDDRLQGCQPHSDGPGDTSYLLRGLDIGLAAAVPAEKGAMHAHNMAVNILDPCKHRRMLAAGFAMEQLWRKSKRPRRRMLYAPSPQIDLDERATRRQTSSKAVPRPFNLPLALRLSFGRRKAPRRFSVTSRIRYLAWRHSGYHRGTLDGVDEVHTLDRH